MPSTVLTHMQEKYLHGSELSKINNCLNFSFLGCISRYSAGSVYYYQSYHHQQNPPLVEKLQKELKRYLTRKIGFEAVMRIRCTKGLREFNLPI